jgi:2-methylcitrate dehydratase PrpD
MPRPDTSGAPAVTRALAAHAASVRFENLSHDAVERARHCIVDWLGVTLAGSRTDLARTIAQEVLEDGAAPRATLLGSVQRSGPLQAALANGAASHALDFDDVHQTMRGHPTVAVLPAVLAEAEARGLDGARVVAAFVAGVEVACRVGALLGDAHYTRGFHATGTAGTFGAAAGVANLRGLDADATARALGIAGSQAAGVKGAFGTMCKPLHAGKAAANGLLAARLAARGFEGRDDILERDQGVGATHTDALDVAAALDGLGSELLVCRVLFKYHAACFGTHATIDAIRALATEHGVGPDAVRRVRVRVPPRNVGMCTIPIPQSGLEGKFSIAYAAGLALHGRDTTSEDSFTDGAVRDPAILAVARRVEVEGDAGVARASADVVLELEDGRRLERHASVLEPEADLGRQGARLEAQCRRLAEPVIGGAALERMLEAAARIEALDTLATLLDPCRPEAAVAA